MLEVIEGFNCTIFAFGQTGTGKTFTMQGDQCHEPSNDEMCWKEDSLAGIMPRSVSHLFSALNAIANCEHSVKMSYMQLHNEELSDLLSDSSENLHLLDYDHNRKGPLLIPGLEEIVVKNKNEVYEILRKRAERKQKAAHSIFVFTVFRKEKSSIDAEETIRVGKLNLVDSTGSESIGRVITALVEQRDNTPHSESSNLTRLLQDSLGGKTKATLIATISPALSDVEETMSTLEYARKAKSIRNRPSQRMVKKSLISKYKMEIEKVKRDLKRWQLDMIFRSDFFNDLERRQLEQFSKDIVMLGEEKKRVEELFRETSPTLSERAEAFNWAEIEAESLERALSETNFIPSFRNNSTVHVSHFQSPSEFVVS